MLPIGPNLLLEGALNNLLRHSPRAQVTLQSIEGKLIALNIQAPAVRMVWLVQGERLALLQGADETADVEISGAPFSLLALMYSQDLASSTVSIHGDLQVARRFTQVIQQLPIDRDEFLSGWLGDFIAHYTGRGVHVIQRWSRRTRGHLIDNTREYLQDELLPTTAECHALAEAIDTLRADTDRLAARIQQLATRSGDKP